MAVYLEEISTLLIQKISNQKLKELANSAEIKRLIEEMKNNQVRLPLEFNIEHIANQHENFYPLKNCQSIHCFECLMKNIEQGRLVCEHSANLTQYEKHHITFITEKLNAKVRPEDLD